MKDIFADAQTRENNHRLLIIGLLLALVGLAVAAYSTFHHMELLRSGQTDFACNINARFSCDAVANSKYSIVFGIPLGVWGLGYFLGVALMLGLGLLKEENRRDALHAYAVLAVVGFVVSLVLGVISWVDVGAFCLSCMGIYAVCLGQLLNFAFNRKVIPWPLRAKTTFNGATVAALGVAIAVIGYNFLKSSQPPATLPTADITDQQGKEPGMQLLPKAAEIKIDRSDYSGLGQDYRKGSDNAKVTVVEFADFECPACKQGSQVMSEVYQEFGDRILVVFKNYPLDKRCNAGMQGSMHKYACDAAVMGRCAGQYGKFWEYHDMAFANQASLNAEAPAKWARSLGLTDAQIAECLKSDAHMAKVKDDALQGGNANVDATPTVFLNGRKYVGDRSASALRTQINRLLNE